MRIPNFGRVPAASENFVRWMHADCADKFATIGMNAGNKLVPGAEIMRIVRKMCATFLGAVA